MASNCIQKFSLAAEEKNRFFLCFLFCKKGKTRPKAIIKFCGIAENKENLAKNSRAGENIAKLSAEYEDDTVL